MDGARPDLETAVAIATDILGYPCPCDSCSDDGGVGKAREIMDLAYDLAGVSPEPSHYQGK